MYICSRETIGCKNLSMPRKKSDNENKLPAEGAALAVSRQALRSERTRTALLTAAEKIFARDGFEASRIEDIAAEANRSRGAFYANFENKTEVFLALRSRAARKRARGLKERIDQVTGEQARYDAVIRFILEKICDSQTLLLQMEFKLFALRHPDLLPELSEKHLEASCSVNLEELHEFFTEHGKDLEQMRRNTLAIEAILEGFAVNALFGPRVLTKTYLEQTVPQLLAKIFHLPARPLKK
jgi:AcrR family transcriptional regulator